MGKTEIVHRMAEKTDLTHTKAEEVVEAILSEIKNALRRGDSAILSRFGSFQVRDKAARIGCNFKTGHEADIPPRRVVLFRSGKPFRDAVNQSTSEILGSLP